MKQDELAEMLGVSPQAVSKWENDQTCPDIGLLPQLAKILGVTVDELLSGKAEEAMPAVRLVPEAERKDVKDMMLRIIVEDGGDKVRVNLPVALIEVALEMGMQMPQVSGNDALKNLDLAKIMELVRRGVMGNLVEVESADGAIVRIFVE
jgi:transcriptional regulator with XRE-family HTH domain